MFIRHDVLNQTPYARNLDQLNDTVTTMYLNGTLFKVAFDSGLPLFSRIRVGYVHMASAFARICAEMLISGYHIDDGSVGNEDHGKSFVNSR